MQNWHLLYNTTTGASVSIGTVIADPLPAGITALPLSDEQGAGLQNGTLKWDEATRSLVPTPPPAVTAEEAVSKYFSPYQIAALQRLEMALLQANKPLGPQMTAAKTWLENVMLGWAVSPVPAPAAAFGVPSVTFEQASAEAVTAQSAAHSSPTTELTTPTIP
jgi:hypothetical protein